MGLYLNTDSQEQIELAANEGWSEVGKWIDSLDAENYPDLVHLWEHGWAEPVSALIDQIQQALQEKPPQSEALKTAAELLQSLSTLAPDGAVVVTNGIEDDSQQFSDWQESDHPRDHGKFAKSNKKSTGHPVADSLLAARESASTKALDAIDSVLFNIDIDDPENPPRKFSPDPEKVARRLVSVLDYLEDTKAPDADKKPILEAMELNGMKPTGENPGEWIMEMPGGKTVRVGSPVDRLRI
jgi:hypothetical protein